MSYIQTLPKFQLQQVKKLDGSKLFHKKVPNFFAKTVPVFLGVRYYPALVECEIKHTFFHEDGSALDDSLNENIKFSITEEQCPYLFVLCMKASHEVLIPLAQDLFLSDKPEAYAYALEYILMSKQVQPIPASPASITKVLGYLAKDSKIANNPEHDSSKQILIEYCKQNYIAMTAANLWNVTTVTTKVLEKMAEKTSLESQIADIQGVTPINMQALQESNDMLAMVVQELAFYNSFATLVGA